MRALALLMLLAAVAGALAGCEAGYIARAAYEEGRVLWRRKPISAVLARSDVSPEERAKLETVLRVRDFAGDQLGLDVGNAYKTISQVDEGAIVWVVMAAPQNSLEPYTWWFPIVGSIPYRGYFKKSHAMAEAAAMESRGYDTMVRPAVAFSSLGFFNDPLLSNLLQLDRVELAGVIIHELFHRTYFQASNVTFDESAATFVGSAGAIKFFDATEGPTSADAEAAREVLDADMKFARFLNGEAQRLAALYKSGIGHEEMLKRRAAIFAEINSDFARLKPHLSGLERFELDREPLNNAVLINYLIYFHDLDSFAKLDRIYQGNLRDTIKAIIALADSDHDDPFAPIERAARLGIAGTTSDADDPQSPPAVPARPAG